MTSGRAPTDCNSCSASAVIWKSTPRRSICPTSSCVVRPLILTALTSPCLLMGFLACIRAAVEKTSAARAASVTTKTFATFRLLCLDMTNTPLAGSAGTSTLHAAVAGHEVGDEPRLLGLLRQRREVVVLAVAAAELDLDVERSDVARAAEQHAEGRADELVHFYLADVGVVRLECVLAVVGLERDVRLRDEERARARVAERAVRVVVEDAERGGAAEVNRAPHVLLGLGDVVLKIQLREAEQLVRARRVRL